MVLEDNGINPRFLHFGENRILGILGLQTCNSFDPPESPDSQDLTRSGVGRNPEIRDLAILGPPPKSPQRHNGR